MITEPLSTTAIPSLGPCGKPCDHPCDSPCEAELCEKAASLWTRLLKASLWNTLDVCFDDVYQEPKTILIVGGCRQMDLSQRLALLLPAADITLVDPDEAVAAKAKEEVCCRFKFIAAPLEALPFDTNAFDLVIAHNFLAYPQNWERAISELGRVTNKNLFFSTHRPWLSGIAQKIPGFTQGLFELGVELPEQLPEKVSILKHLTLYTKIKTKLTPFPWTVYMTQKKPAWEEKLVLN